MPPRRKRSQTEVDADAAKKAKSYEIADDADEVLSKCRALKQQLLDARSAPKDTSAIPKDIIEVSELSSDHVMEGMECVAIQIANSVLQKKGFSMEIPSRAASNQVYIKEWDRIVLGSKTGTRSFLNVKVCIYIVSLLRAHGLPVVTS